MELPPLEVARSYGRAAVVAYLENPTVVARAAEGARLIALGGDRMEVAAYFELVAALVREDDDYKCAYHSFMLSLLLCIGVLLQHSSDYTRLAVI
jgi:hypothetical protein